MRALLAIAASVWCIAAQAGEPTEEQTTPALIAIKNPSSRNLCIIENGKVRPGFVDAYREALLHKGLNVAVIAKPDRFYDCPLTSTYVASWDEVGGAPGNFISYVKLSVYQDGRRVGYVRWRSNGWVMTKAETRIGELVDQLFPQP